MEGDTLVFVEVRARSGRDRGGAAESITISKQRRIASAAKYYLSRLKKIPECRFDAVLFEEKGKPEWIRGAFLEPDGRSSRFR